MTDKKTNNVREMKYAVCIFTMFVILRWFGFPGEYVKVFGISIETAVKYSVFFVQLGLMFFTSGNNPEEIRLLDLKYRYKIIYLFLFSVTVISLIGSNNPKRAAELCFSLTINALFALWICDHFSVREMLSLTCSAQLVFVILSVIYPLFFPAYYYDATREGVFLGILRIKNVTAAQMAFGVVVQSILLKTKIDEDSVSTWFLLFYGVQWALLLLTDGGNAILSAIIPVIYIFFFSGKRRFNWGFINIAVSTGFIVFAMTAMQALEPILNYFGKDATLTGRTVTWEKIIQIMQESHTLTGYGYCQFWEDPEAVAVFHKGFNDTNEVWYSQMTAGAHNNLMELWLTIGLAGIAVYFIVLVLALRSPWKWEKEKYVFISGYSILFIVFGLTEKAFTTFGYMTTYLILMLAYALNTPIKKHKKIKNNTPISSL